MELVFDKLMCLELRKLSHLQSTVAKKCPYRDGMQEVGTKLALNLLEKDHLN